MRPTDERTDWFAYGATRAPHGFPAAPAALLVRGSSDPLPPEAASNRAGRKAGSALASGRRLELFETLCEPIAVGTILPAPWQSNLAAMQVLERLEHRTVPLGEKALGDM